MWGFAMKKFKIVMLSVLLCFGLVFFSACKDDGKSKVLAENISVSSQEVSIELGELTTIEVNILPSNVSSKDFEVIMLSQDIVTISYDKQNMQFTINAPNEIEDGRQFVELEVRTLDGSDLNTHISVTLTQRSSAVSAPKNVHYDGEKLVWSEVNGAKGYVVNINGTDMPEVYSNSYAVDLVGETITAKVKALGETGSLDSAYSAEYIFKILPAPKNIAYTKNGVLQWDAVDGATGYTVYVDGQLTYSATSQLDLSGRFVEAKAYEIKVKAIGDDNSNFVDSVFSDYITVTKLNSPQNVRIENGILLWDTVLGATEYLIVVDENEPWSISKTEYSLPQTLTAGDHMVKVQAVGNGTNFVTSDLSITIDFYKLAKITKIFIKDGVVCWDENLEATNYMLYVNGVPHQTSILNTTSYDFVDYASGTYSLNVMAVGNGGNILNSDLMSDDFVAVKLATPSTLQITKQLSQNLITWEQVVGANKYVVEIDDTIVSGDGLTLTNMPLPQDLQAGFHNIKLKAIGDSSNHISSNYTQPLSIQKLAVAENLKVSNGQIVWDKVSNVSQYQVSILYSVNGEIQEDILSTADVTFNLNSSSDKTYDAGAYSVRIKAIGKDNFTIDSDYSVGLSVTKLGSPTLKVEEGKIQPVSIENAEKIEYVINGETTYDIENYIFTDNAQITIKARALAPQSTNYVHGDYSKELVCLQLPKITDLKIEDGKLSFGSTNYSSLETGLHFEVVIKDKNNTDEATNTSTIATGAKLHDLSVLNASSYNVTVCAISDKNGVSEVDGDGNVVASSVPYLTSQVSNALNFEVLSAPTNLRVKSVAHDGTTIEQLIASLKDITSSMPGILNWDEVENAIQYILEIDGKEYQGLSTTSTNLQDEIIAGGSHTIRVKAVGNGQTSITSKYSDYITTTKLESPTNLKISDGVLTWDSNYNQDINLFSEDVNIVIYVAQINGQNYTTFDVKSINFDNILSLPSNIINALQKNEYTLPELSATEYSVKLFAVPLNSYITSVIDLSIDETTNSYMLSNFNQTPLYLKSLQTPLNLSLSRNDENEEVLSWSHLLYANGEVAEYEILIESESGEEVVTVPFGTNQWIFNETNFAQYKPGTYSFSVRAIASENAMYQDKYYFVNSQFTTAVTTTVMANPELVVQNGVVVWDDITGAQKYILLVDGQIVETTKTSYELDSTYSAGNHSFKIMAYGDGTKYISSEYSTEKIFVKLDKIVKVGNNEAVRVENGIVVYNNNSIVDNEANYCEYVVNINGKDYKNGKSLSHELEGFAAGDYTIYVYCSGDSTIYLKSDASEICVNAPVKLSTPTNLAISNGILTWNSVSNTTSYKIYISGLENNIEVTTVGVSYNFNQLESGDYKIKLKALGNSISYINSNWSAELIISKLSEITNLRVENGVITWDKVSSSANNNLKLAIRKNGESKYTEISINASETTYVLDESYVAGDYNVYMYNNGGTNAISSANTNMITVTKLDAPSNLRIESDSQDESVQYIAFDSVSNAGGYILKINEQEIELTQTKLATKDLEYYGISIEQSGTYNISVSAVGAVSPFVNSNFSENLIITKPSAPVLSAVYTDSTNSVFSGKVVWEDVEYSDFYRVTIQKEIGTGWETSEYTTNSTYLYVTTNTNYKISVVACKTVNGFDSEPSNELSLSYSLFVGSGTEDDPYKVASAENFNNIVFNNIAHYVLTTDIDFQGKTLRAICSESQQFEGVIDGGNFSIYNLTISNNSSYNGLVPVLAESGKIINLTLTTNVADGEVVGGIVGTNYGLVENCVANGNISPIYNSANKTVKVGGIVAINYGTVSKCVNNANILPQNSLNVTYAGGIVAENFGLVTGSGNNGSISATIAGGIASQNSSQIIYCYNNANAVVTATAFKASNHNAYAGGIVGYNNGNSISHSYNIGNVIAISDSSSVVAYAGGLVAYNDGATISYCYSSMGSSSTQTNIYTQTPNDDGYAAILVGYNNKGQITQNNVSIYTNSLQRGAYNVTSQLFRSTSYSNLDEYTVADYLGSAYDYSDTIYPTLNTQYAKY